jgi:hypothetical protein
MPHPPSTALQRPAAFVLQRLPWLMLAFGLLLAWTMLAGHPSAAPDAMPSTGFDQVSAVPGGGHPADLPDMVAISESGAESSRTARPRPTPADLLTSLMIGVVPSRMFLAAATDTRLRHALERSHHYPAAPYLLLNPGHAPPLA